MNELERFRDCDDRKGCEYFATIHMTTVDDFVVKGGCDLSMKEEAGLLALHDVAINKGDLDQLSLDQYF